MTSGAQKQTRRHKKGTRRAPKGRTARAQPLGRAPGPVKQSKRRGSEQKKQFAQEKASRAFSKGGGDRATSPLDERTNIKIKNCPANAGKQKKYDPPSGGFEGGGNTVIVFSKQRSGRKTGTVQKKCPNVRLEERGGKKKMLRILEKGEGKH